MKYKNTFTILLTTTILLSILTTIRFLFSNSILYWLSSLLLSLVLFNSLILIPSSNIKKLKILLIIQLLITLLTAIISKSTIIPLKFLISSTIYGFILRFLLSKIKIVVLTFVSSIIIALSFNKLFILLFNYLNLTEVGFPIFSIFLPFIGGPFTIDIMSFFLSNKFSSLLLSLSFSWFLIAYPTLSYFYQKKKLWLRLLLPYILIALLSFWDNYKFYLTSLALAAVGWFLGWITVKTGLRQLIINILFKKLD